MSARLRVLIVHNRYRQEGGEEVVVEAEAALLEQHGHAVERFEASNDELAAMPAWRAATRAVWNGDSRARLAEVQARFRPDVVHFHNTFPLLSPSVYYARSPVRPATIQTLHNFRLLCPAATLMRAGKPCELCVGGVPWRAVAHACYRQSRSASLVSVATTRVHHALGTWQKRVDAYIALTPVTRDIFIRGGLPAERIHVKPNFLAPDPGVGRARGEHFLFVGRLSDEKGIRVLLAAWSLLPSAPSLRLIGSGPLSEEVARFAATGTGIQLIGHVSRERVLAEMKSARGLIAPTLCYENFPLTLCEAMATGCPIIASDLPNVRSLLAGGEGGELFRPGDPRHLAETIAKAAHSDAAIQRKAAAARNFYETRYTAAANYPMLLTIYRWAARTRQATVSP